MSAGRPPGARVERPEGVLPGLPRKLVTGKSKRDFQYPDPDTIVARQLSMLSIAQQAVRNEMLTGTQSEGTRMRAEDILKLEKLSSAIVRAIDALKKTSDLTGVLSSRMSPEELLEAALVRVEGQDVPTIRYAMKRLKAHLARLSDSSPKEPILVSGADALAAIELE